MNLLTICRELDALALDFTKWITLSVKCKDTKKAEAARSSLHDIEIFLAMCSVGETSDTRRDVTLSPLKPGLIRMSSSHALPNHS